MEPRPATIDRDPDWQPVTKAQVRPQGATPVYVALVPAFNDCLAPNGSHDPPLVHPTCVPPQQTSDDLIVGEPQVNGRTALFRGSVRIRTLGADLQVTASLSDVMCARPLAGKCTGGPLSDFTGSLSLEYDAYIADRSTLGVSGSTAGASSLLGFNFAVPCASTAALPPPQGRVAH